MKAKTVNELQKFERGQEPKTAMNIGMTGERRLDQLGEKLEKLGIEISYDQSYNYGKGAWDISIMGTDALADENLQIMYFTDELSQAEFDEPGGFTMATEFGEELLEYSEGEISQDPTFLIKKLIELKYGDISGVKAKIIVLKKQIKKLEEIEKYLTKG